MLLDLFMWAWYLTLYVYVPVCIICDEIFQSRKEFKTKSFCLVRDEEGAGPSQQEEELGPEIINLFLSLGEQPGETLVICLL